MITLQCIANRFKLQDLFGRGGMGEVYRAIDSQTGETVAVKALNPEVLANDPSLLERFVREGEALCQLRPPEYLNLRHANPHRTHRHLR
jgi:serine/threonine kinase PknH